MSVFGDNNSTMDIVVRLQDQASAGLKQLRTNVSSTADMMMPTIKASVALAAGLTAAGAAAGSFGLMAVKSAANAEQTQIAFTTMLGSVEKAKEFYADLVHFAATTPFELKGLEQSSKQLLAYGFSQQEVLPNLKALGDVAAGVGMDKLPQLILAFGQVKAATKLTGNELRQFTEAGVPLLDELAKIMKKPVSAIQEMVSAGEIGFPVVQQAMQNLTGEGGRFNNLMDKQAKSLGGMWSNLQDAWEQFLRNQGAMLIEWAKQFVGVMIEIVQVQLPKWVKATQDIVKWLGEHTEVVAGLAGALGALLLPAMVAAGAGAVLMAAEFAPLILGGAIIGGVIAGVVYLVKHWDELKERFDQFMTDSPVLSAAWDAIKQVMSDLWNTIKTQLWPALQDLWSTVKEQLWPALKELWEALTPLIPVFEMLIKVVGILVGAGLLLLILAFTKLVELTILVITWMTKLTTFIVETISKEIKNFAADVQKVADAFQQVVQWIQTAIDKWNQWKSSGASLNPMSPSFQLPFIGSHELGGMVPGPVGQAVPIMAHGQERIIPASQAANYGAGGGVNVTINYPSFNNASDEMRMRRMIEETFRPLLINHKIA